MSSTQKPHNRRTLAGLARRGSDIVSLNRAMVHAIRGRGSNLQPGELALALREGRVTITVLPASRGDQAA